MVFRGHLPEPSAAASFHDFMIIHVRRTINERKIKKYKMHEAEKYDLQEPGYTLWMPWVHLA